jgi:hypothetical protein
MQVEDQTTNIESQVSNNATIQTEATQENQINENQETQNVYDHVNPETDDPKLVQARIDTLYRERKTAKEDYRKMMDLAKKQSEVIEDLQNGMYAVAGHLQQEKFADTEATLKSQYRIAVETGDIDAQVNINDKLLELKAQKLIAPKAQSKQQQTQSNPQQQYNSANELAADLDPQEQAITNAWQNEKDESGQSLRPWAVNSTGDLNDPDPDFIKAITVANKVFTQENFAHLTYQQKLQEIDKRMGIKKSIQQSNVMGGHLTGQRKNSKVTITAKQSEIAVRTKFGGPKAKSDAEHIEAFRKQIEKVQSTKGTR